MRRKFAHYNHRVTPQWSIGLAAVAIVAAQTGASAPAEPALKHARHAAQPIPAECVRMATHAEQARCLNPYFHDAVRSGRTRVALGQLADLVRAGTLDDCHHLAHDLGHVGFETQGNLATALRAGGADCLNGYYHGVVEAAVHQAAAQGPLEIGGMCRELRGEAMAYDGCVHGLGHGLMLVYNDVMRARRMCDALPEGYARQRCAGGVYMQNSMRFLDLDDARYRTTAPRACDGLPLPADDRALCNGQIGEIAMFYYRHDLNKALGVCRVIGNRTDAASCERGARTELATSRLERKPG